MNEHGNGPTAWIMGIAAVLMTTLLCGSFIYTWSADNANNQEKREWRDKHESKHEREIETLNKNQKAIAEKIDQRYDETQKVLQEILIETLAAKQAAKERRTR